MLRVLGALAIVVALIATVDAGTAGVAEQSPSNSQGTVVSSPAPVGNPKSANLPALFITLPMTSGFADATDALVETQGFVRDALNAGDAVRLVDRLPESDAILTVLGRGTGYVELTAALQGIDSNVVAPPVMLHANERYIEVMLTVGTCGEAATNATIERKGPSCYRKIFVGLGDHDVRQGATKAAGDRDARQGATKVASNSWTICADALARDVQAWVTQNATRLLAFRGYPR
jgi:hypothetical protein